MLQRSWAPHEVALDERSMIRLPSNELGSEPDNISQPQSERAFAHREKRTENAEARQSIRTTQCRHRIEVVQHMLGARRSAKDARI